MHPARIRVVGGGAAGLALAIALAHRARRGHRAEITLIDPRAAHVWKPRLHEIAAGTLSVAQEQADYDALARQHGFGFTRGAVDRIDLAAQTLHLGALAPAADDAVGRAHSPEAVPARALTYDVAVLATGSTANDFGLPGVAEHCYTLDTAEDADRLHRAIQLQTERLKARLQSSLQVVIVGAGTTGVELAAELRGAYGSGATYDARAETPAISILLLEMAERPLPGLSRAVSDYAGLALQRLRIGTRYGTRVASVERSAVVLSNGDRVTADLVIWASGVRAHAPDTDSPLQRDHSGRIVVDDYLRAQLCTGANAEGLFCIGDCAAATTGGSVVGATAQAGRQEAKLLTHSLTHWLQGRPLRAFQYRDRGSVITFGSEAAVGQTSLRPGDRSLRFSGVSAKLAYTALHFEHRMDVYGPVRAVGFGLSDLVRLAVQPAIKFRWS